MMRWDLTTGGGSLTLKPDGGTSSMRPFLVRGEQGPQGLPGVGSAAWTATTPVTTGTVRQAPDGSWITSKAARTTRTAFDATEQGFWDTVSATPGTLEQLRLTASIDARVPAASPTAQGKVELATTAETTTGTDAARAVTPAGLKVVTDAEVARANVAYDVARTNRLVVLGDSYTEICLSTSGTGPFGQTIFYSARGALAWAQLYSGAIADVVNVAGITGQTTAQIMARFDTDVTPYSPAVVVMNTAGTNDALTGVPLATTVANIVSFIAKCRAIGAIPVLVNLPPISLTGGSPPTTAQRNAALAINQYLRDLHLSERGAYVIDQHAVLSDGSTSDDFLNKADQAPTKYTADGLHLAAWGAARVGRVWARLFTRLFKPGARLAYSGVDTATSGLTNKNFLANAGMAGTGGTLNNGATGSVADSWRIRSGTGGAFAGTVVASKQTRSYDSADPLYANMQLQRIVSTGANNVLFDQPGISSGYSTGDVIQGSMYLKQGNDWANVTALRLTIYARDASNNRYQAYAFDFSSPDVLPTENDFQAGVWLRTPRLVVPASTAAIGMEFQFVTSSGGGGTLDVGAGELRKVA